MSPTSLEMDVQYLPGAGPTRAALLAKLAIRTVADLLWHLPRDVLDLTEVKLPSQLQAGKNQTVAGTVVDLDARQLSGGRTLTCALIDCTQGYVRGTWFNQPWMIHRLQHGQRVLFSGKPKRHAGRWEFNNPRVQWLSEEDSLSAGGGVIPRYGLTEGLRQSDLLRLMRVAVERFADQVPEHLPEKFLKQHKLPQLGQALWMVHLPESIEAFQLGQKRILFDDLLEFQTGVALRRRAWRARRGAPVVDVTAKIDARIRRLFPFSFTEGQTQAVREIAGDLRSGHAMHRLLQADVGAGKTVVAIYAMLAAVAHGLQAVLMAPTELLAVQHWQTIDAALVHSRVRRALLTGSLSASERRRVVAGIESGDIQLVVGTQALIQEAVQFKHLAVAVIDEQHKFGVAQRATFSSGNGAAPPHVLVMTATPIPRSLSLTQFGDLDLTIVRDRPAGRQRIVTSRISGAGARKRAWDFVRQQLKAGRQLYVVCPKISDADDSGGPGQRALDSEIEDDLENGGGPDRRRGQGRGTDAPAEPDHRSPESAIPGPAPGAAGAEQVFRDLSEGELRGFRLGLVHGQMDRDLRRVTMESFREHELDALVSTTVIEVGVDVPNATLMVVLQAEKFGLSQLHQLRGRVARGSFRGYCFLFSESTAPESSSRLSALERSDDGFQIAETDFQIRGPGDVLGRRQHGGLPLKVADVVRDGALLEEVREIAFLLVGSGEVDTAEFAPLKLRVLDRFAELMDLPRSG